jgi:hypothetical protein
MATQEIAQHYYTAEFEMLCDLNDKIIHYNMT